MICGVFSRITFELVDFIRELGSDSRQISVIEKRVINELAKIRETKTSHKRDQ